MGDVLGGLDLDFSGAATLWNFLHDDNFVRGIRGPVGGGKSYAACSEVMLRAVKQKPSPVDNTRYTRFVIVRNSYPELRTTTIKTWQEIFPENVWGSMRWSPPITHHIKMPARDGAAGIDCEVIFLALDQPKDVRKLLSLELTGAFVNEARELPVQVIEGLTHRVGRYPTQRDGGCTWRGIWMDTNSMDDDHWWHRLAEKEPVKGRFAWKFYAQPGAIIEADPDEVPKEQPEYQGFHFSAGKWWRMNPAAENIRNLPNGYYEQMLGGKSLDWLRCYVQNKYTYVQEGKPVWPEYDDQIMVADMEPDPSLPLHIGLDFGLTPAACFGQKTPGGQWRVMHEIVTYDMGLERFGHMLLTEINTRFPKYEVFVWGDPAGMKRDEIFEVTAFDHLKTIGLRAQPTASNNFMVRRESGAAPMNRMVMGKPGLLVNRSCKMVRKSLSGGYCFKRVAAAGGGERFKDSPDKGPHSHIGDAYGYMCQGGGEHKALTRNRSASTKTVVAQTVVGDFDVFDY